MSYVITALKAVGSLLVALISVCIIIVPAVLFVGAIIIVASLLLAIRAWEKIFPRRNSDHAESEASRKARRERHAVGQ